jgi:hypothetical protein
MCCNAQHGSRAAAIVQRRWWWRQSGGNVQLGSVAVALSLAAQRQCHAWQCGGSIKHFSTAAGSNLAVQLCSAASLGYGRASHHQCRAATARRRGGDDDTSGNSNDGGIHNQQPTKSTETATITATLIRVVVVEGQ